MLFMCSMYALFVRILARLAATHTATNANECCHGTCSYTQGTGSSLINKSAVVVVN